MTTQKIQQRSEDGQHIESAIADGVPHMTYHDQRTGTTFCWTGDPDHWIEVSAGYGEPVGELIPLPLLLRRPAGDMITMLEAFKYVCEGWIHGAARTTPAAHI